MGDGCRILVVDDDAGMCEILSKKFESFDFVPEPIEVDIARDGELAIPLLRAHTYRLIVVDYIMPNINGMRLIEMIRKSGNANHATPILCISGYLVQAEEKMPPSFPKDVMFLEKPFADEDLRKIVAGFLTSEQA